MNLKHVMRLKYLSILASTFVLSVGSVFAALPTVGKGVTEIYQQENIQVKGKVVDEFGEGLIGASVVLKGSPMVGVSTDMNGDYTLSVPKGGTIVISYVGFKPIELIVRKEINDVTLLMDSQMMDELVVVGYGTMKKSDITGAIASVDNKKIARQPVANVASALQGLATGVSVTSNSGSPGASATIRIRGVGTVNDASPLFVVDGMPVTDINYLSTSDIQSMEVLKDASASAIYGSRGANGVILITTKKGETGKATVTLDAYWGVSKLLNNLDLMDGEDWYGFQTEVNKVKEATGVEPVNLDLIKWTPEQVNSKYLMSNMRKLPDGTYISDTDWMKEVSRTAFMHNYSLGVSGGRVDDYKYNFGFNYLNQEGTIKRSEYERISIRQSTEKTIIKDYLTMGSNITISNSNSSGISEYNNQGLYDADYGVISNAIRVEPVVASRYKLRDGSGNATGDWIYGSSPYIDYYNPLADLNYNDSKNKQFTVVGNVYGEVSIIKGLKLKSSFGAEIRRNNSKNFSPVYFVSNSQKNNETFLSKNNGKGNYYTWENTLSYIKTFKEKHNLNIVLGYTNEWGKSENLGGSGTDFVGEAGYLQYFGAGLDKSKQTLSNSASDYAMISYLGRAHYEYDNRYLVTATFRRDGSSKFSKDNRWGNFPSFAVGWRIDNEEFFKNMNATWISSLKFRAGWGRIGNQSIDNYQYYNLLSLWSQYGYLFGAGSNETLYQGMAVRQLGNNNIKWETTESTNIGIDATFLNNRLMFSFEYYDKSTKDMLLAAPMPLYMGYSSNTFTNIGEANNRGVELNLEWRDKVSDFEYSIGFNMSTIRNRMTKLNGGTPISSGVIRNQNATYTTEGMPIGVFWGYKTNGLIQTEEQLAEVKKVGYQPDAQLGDVYFMDANNDGKLTDADKTMIGKSIPDVIYGFNIGLAWKNFDLNMQFGGTIGNDIFNAMRIYTYNVTDITNKDRALLNYWTPENKNTNIPRLSATDANNNNRLSDRYVESGTFLRLRNLQLGYTLPQSITKKAMLEKVRVYMSGQNLFTITSYSGIDPEVGQSSSLSRGVDYGIYPQSRVITGGINITF